MKHKVLKTALYVVLALVGVITVFPFVWMVLSSFKTNGEIQSIVQTLLPQEPTTDNYMNLQQTFDFLRYFMNSIFIAVAVDPACDGQRIRYLHDETEHGEHSR